jgi:hypothetical protein
VPSIRELADQLCRALAGFEPGRYSGADCAELAEGLARVSKASATASIRAAARAADCGEHRKRGHADAHDWIARAAGSSHGAARAELATVEKVSARPETADALRSGEVSLAQAGEITSAPAEHEGELLELARRSGLRPVRERARKYQLAAIHADELHAGRQVAREVVHGTDDLGMTWFRGALPPEVGVRFANRLDRETDRVWRAARAAGAQVTRAQCAADAFVRLVTGTARAPAGRTDLVFVLDLVAWARGHAHPGEACHVLGGGPVPVSVIRRHIADAFVKVALHDGTKVDTIVHYGRRRPAALQSVLDLGEPPRFEGVTCAEDGCDRCYQLEWDHVDPVANGGATARGNVQPLCWPHHVEKTARDRTAGLLGSRRERAP